MIYYARNDMFELENPAIEAVINFRWRKAKFFFAYRSLLFIIFGACFNYISWAYINSSGESLNLLIVSIIIFYYLAAYQIIAKIIQAYYDGCTRYFKNMFDRIALYGNLIPTAVMIKILCEFRISNGFGSVETVNIQTVA